MVSRRKSTPKPSTKATRRRGLRANDLQALIALEDWDAIARTVATEAVSYTGGVHDLGAACGAP